MASWKQGVLEFLRTVLRDDFGDRAPKVVRVTWREYRGDFRVRGRNYIVSFDRRRKRFRVYDSARRAGLRVPYFKSQCEIQINI